MSKHPTIEIIITPCVKSQEGWRSWGLDVRQKFTHYDLAHHEDSPMHSAALRQANPFRKPGLCVIVRPNYNDLLNAQGERGFREWRSFDGGEFEECRFGFTTDYHTAEEWTAFRAQKNIFQMLWQYKGGVVAGNPEMPNFRVTAILKKDCQVRGLDVEPSILKAGTPIRVWTTSRFGWAGVSADLSDKCIGYDGCVGGEIGTVNPGSVDDYLMNVCGPDGKPLT